MNSLKLAVSVGLLLICVQAEYTGKLQFKADNTFKIQQITDTHYGHPDQSEENNEQVTSLINMEDADVIAMTGDMVSGYDWNGEAGWYHSMWLQWTSPIDTTKKPYFYLLGNHDAQADLDRRQIMELDMTHPYSMSGMTPPDIGGASNYVLPIYDPTGTEVVFYLWVLDSGFENCQDVKGAGCITDSQVQWYVEKTAELEKKDGRVVPGIALFHIPTPEWLLLNNNGYVKGYKTEATSCWSVNTGFYSAARRLGNISAFICGHDHDNDFMGEYNGIYLIYGRKTGFGSYGPRVYMPRGSRMFEFTYDPSTKEVTWDTYIRNHLGYKEEAGIAKWIPQLRCDGMDAPGYNPPSAGEAAETFAGKVGKVIDKLPFLKQWREEPINTPHIREVIQERKVELRIESSLFEFHLLFYDYVLSVSEFVLT